MKFRGEFAGLIVNQVIPPIRRLRQLSVHLDHVLCRNQTKTKEISSLAGRQR